MKRVELKKIEHSVKIGDKCKMIEPNIIEDTIFLEDGVPIGFYIRDIGKFSEKAKTLLNIANNEFLSDRVPKSQMNRSTGEMGTTKKVQQYSTIIGSVQPRPHMRRPYASVSSVHSSKTAENFIKAMLMLTKECENLIKQIIPEVYDLHEKCIEESVPKKWRFGKLFTSSISNFNISANYHRDAGNIIGCVNVILCKRKNSTGGNTTIPDYGATVESCDNSMLVYPAWRNVHGVTPIVPLVEGGYRNSLVFYPLKAFKNI